MGLGVINLSEKERAGLRRNKRRKWREGGRDLLHFDERNVRWDVPPERNKMPPTQEKRTLRNKEEKKARGDPLLRTNWVLLTARGLQLLAILPLCLYSILPFCWRGPFHKYLRNCFPYSVHSIPSIRCPPSPARKNGDCINLYAHLPFRSLHLPITGWSVYSWWKRFFTWRKFGSLEKSWKAKAWKAHEWKSMNAKRDSVIQCPVGVSNMHGKG